MSDNGSETPRRYNREKKGEATMEEMNKVK